MAKRTTILADEVLLLEARHFAKQNGTSFTKVVETALREYMEAHRPARHMEFIGMGCSSGPVFSVADGWDEEILAAAADPVAGWAPDAPVRRNGVGVRS